jgi:peptidyl-prolyl cis-trans isomerase C
MNRRTPFLVAVLAAACAGPRASTRPPPEPVLARVNGDAITASELRREFGASHEGHTKFLVAGESEAKSFLEKLVDKHLLLQEAQRMGILDRADVRAAVAEFETEESVRHLVDVEVTQPAKATDEQVKAVYDGATEVLDVREIRCDTREQAERARTRIAAGEPFDMVAREVSNAPTHVYGGLAKRIGWGGRSPEWEAVAFAAKTGELSPVFETPDGWELVQVEERTPITKPDLTAVAGNIRSTLETRRRQELDLKLRAALAARWGLEVLDPPAPQELVRVAAAGDQGTKDPAAERVVARWKGGSLSLGELGANVNAKALAAQEPARYDRIVRAIVKDEAQARLLRLEVQARGTAKDPAVAEKVAEKRDKIAVDVVLAEYVMKDVSTTEEDARAFYDAKPEAFAVPESRDVAHVQVATEEEAKAVKALLAAGTPWEEVVKTRSTNEKTKAIGGSLGFVTRSECPPGFEQVFALKEGELTDPIEGKGGFHVLKVRSVVPAITRPYEQVRDEVLLRLRRKRLDDALALWTTRLRAVSRIERDPAAMAAFVKSSEKDAESLSGGAKPLPSGHGMPSSPGGPSGHGTPSAGGPPGHGMPPAGGPHGMPPGEGPPGHGMPPSGAAGAAE